MPVQHDHGGHQQHAPAAKKASNSSSTSSTGGSRMSSTPRKFAEKIAHLQRMNEAGQQQFDEVIKDVQQLTRTEPTTNAISVDMMESPGDAATASVSLPNVHQVLSFCE